MLQRIIGSSSSSIESSAPSEALVVASAITSWMASHFQQGSDERNKKIGELIFISVIEVSKHC